MAAFQADDGYEEPHVIAEIGCNHMGQFEIAKELLTLGPAEGDAGRSGLAPAAAEPASSQLALDPELGAKPELRSRD